MEIGNKIKKLRQKSGLTQEQLANKLGVSAQSISKWENAVAMPDITLLPVLADEFGVSIDELFDLTVQEKFKRIDSRLDKNEELSGDIFKEYEMFLVDEMCNKEHSYQATSLLAHLYHHRMESDAEKVKKYAQKAIIMHPENKDCQWLLNMAAGQRVWDWNVANHSEIIDFYKSVIESDNIQPKTPMPYYYLIDNLLADKRTLEARKYLDEMALLPAHNPILIPIYKAHIALTELDEDKAEEEIKNGMNVFESNGAYLFEVAQYYAGKACYDRAIEFYEKSWLAEENSKPRFTDALEGMAAIYLITKNKGKLIETYDRIIQNLKEEWYFTDDDSRIMELYKKKSNLLK